MKVEKVFYRGKKYPEDFNNEVIDYLVNEYGCDKEIADIRVHDCLSLGWSLCESLNGVVGIQTNYNRSKIEIGQ